jgi:CheY-like chemotaxis protein
VIEASDGVEALERVREARPDIVLMDIAMPNMTGDEALAVLRAERGAVARTPVIALTAYAMRDEVDRFLALGFDRCLAKPVVRSQIAAAMAALLGGHRIAGVEPRPEREPPAAMPAAAYIDRETLARLLESVGPEVGRRLVQSFVEDVAAALDKVEEARATRDIAVLERQSHTLDGLAATFGVTTLALAAREVNHACRRHEGRKAIELAETLARDGRAALEAFRSLTSGPDFGVLAA